MKRRKVKTPDHWPSQAFYGKWDFIMTEHEQNTLLLQALEDIRDRAMDHPLFDEVAFQHCDVESLAKQGGDICDWTMIAILAQDALNHTI